MAQGGGRPVRSEEPDVSQRFEEAVAEAREQASAAKSERDRFLAILSHETRTPLSVILGWVQLLREQPDAEMIDKGVETIERNANAIASLLEEALDFSRLSARKMSLDMRPLDLARVTRLAVDSVLPRAKEKNVAVEARLDSGAFVSGDFRRLSQVVMNLLSNALKFTPSGGRVEIECRRQGANVALVVKDSGKGIRAEDLPHLFECFRQFGESSRSAEGLGLGLFIVRRIVEMHGGSVRARSDGEQNGAAFFVDLPHVFPPAPGSSRGVARRA
jgi:signal transduction histidine kinase